MVHRPTDISAFEFVVLASLRASQLMRGCIPREEGVHKTTVMAQMEVANRSVVRAPNLQIVPVE